MPRSFKNRPTRRLVRRSMTSTMVPSGLPRYSPDGLTSTRSPCKTFCISRADKKRSWPPASGTKKPKPSRWPCTRPATKSNLLAGSSTPLRLGNNCPSRSIAAMRRSKPVRVPSRVKPIRAAKSSGDKGIGVKRKTSKICSRLGTSGSKSGMLSGETVAGRVFLIFGGRRFAKAKISLIMRGFLNTS